MLILQGQDQTQYFYVVKTTEKLNQDALTRLENLLQAQRVEKLPADAYVLPRLGTKSPWSSKALDILRLCDLSQIERIERGITYSLNQLTYDRMTESVLYHFDDLQQCFNEQSPKPLQTIDDLNQANQTLGLALSATDIEYLSAVFKELKRNPTDAELMMFAQVNSEHCRHKIFKSEFIIDGQTMEKSLFDMIRNTYQAHPDSVLSAYKDNAAVMKGNLAARFYFDEQRVYHYHKEDAPILMKVETHNHPTAIAPFAGAATGAGGEIRDEGATGLGGKPKAGLVGFTVSNLRLPDFPQNFENDENKPQYIASPLDIMLEGPIGAARYNNEFGRPSLCGYFRSYEQTVDGVMRAYHKPIMIAGGMGLVRPMHVQKQEIPDGSLIIILGGPSFIIGLGGGSASSRASGSSEADLDFASVQRDNAEMERRCQEVIDRCWAFGEHNPILSIHDVGAGGLSNAVPEIVHDAGRGGLFNLRHIHLGDPSLSPMEIWCNESQERYVLAIDAKQLETFTQIAQRERCPFAVLGTAQQMPQLQVQDPLLKNDAVNMPMMALFPKQETLQRNTTRKIRTCTVFNTATLDIKNNLERILQHPTVADKSFLITIGDRSVGGLTHRDQMVGPWQIPVADVAVTLTDFQHETGEAMAMGERSPLAVLNAAASGRMAVAEAITNIAAARIDKISDIKLSANWMAASSFSGEDADLFDTVKAIGMELCPALGICIPVGKDSLSMRMVWDKDANQQQAISPVSLIISAFAPVLNVRDTLTPELNATIDTQILLIDLGHGKNRLAGSILSQIHNTVGEATPDLDNAQDLKNFFGLIQSLNNQQLILAYHDRSDGGAWSSICEMAFASRCGVNIDLPENVADPLAFLANEELGALLQIDSTAQAAVWECIRVWQLDHCTKIFATPNKTQQVIVQQNNQMLCQWDLATLQQQWSRVSYEMRKLRDNPECAQQEYDNILNNTDTGLFANLTYDLNQKITAPFVNVGTKPKVAILREQGVNGHVEMAAAFDAAGFTAIDVHMSDILSGKEDLTDFHGLIACGGFSYGDVLGAGRGWASTILYHARAKNVFQQFFARNNTFTLGVCNGCQMLAQLQDIIPGAQGWPIFKQNISRQFEARFVMVEVLPSNSIFMRDMIGSRMPIVVSHGEGFADFANTKDLSQTAWAMRYVDNAGQATMQYPFNPNGSPNGVTGFTNADGRVTIMMPHPERVVRALQCSWRDKLWLDASPWRRMFENARVWVG
jgi:phosphoribosylformylglycinamidine synthase